MRIFMYQPQLWNTRRNSKTVCYSAGAVTCSPSVRWLNQCVSSFYALNEITSSMLVHCQYFVHRPSHTYLSVHQQDGARSANSKYDSGSFRTLQTLHASKTSIDNQFMSQNISWVTPHKVCFYYIKDYVLWSRCCLIVSELCICMCMTSTQCNN